MKAAIVIERGIPIPSVRGESKWSEVLAAMKIGDSVHLPYSEAVKLNNYMRNHGVHPIMRQTTPRGTTYDRQMVRVWHNGELTEEQKQEKRKKSHERVRKMRASDRMKQAQRIINGNARRI